MYIFSSQIELKLFPLSLETSCFTIKLPLSLTSCHTVCFNMKSIQEVIMQIHNRLKSSKLLVWTSLTSEVSALVQPPGNHRFLGIFLLPEQWPFAAPLQLLACHYLSRLSVSTVKVTAFRWHNVNCLIMKKTAVSNIKLNTNLKVHYVGSISCCLPTEKTDRVVVVQQARMNEKGAAQAGSLLL